MSRWVRVVDRVFDVAEGIAALYDFVRRLQKSDPAPIPLPKRHADHQQGQIHRATTIRPPPP
jgi:hypothetical protein